MGGRGGAGGVIRAIPPKVGDEIRVADWFNFDLPSYAMRPSRAVITGESTSGKAWKVDIQTETLDGERDLQFTKYMPKAAALSPSQVRKAEVEEAKRFADGKKRYNKMLEFAKRNGVKGVREGLRKETILERIKKAGLSYTY